MVIRPLLLGAALVAVLAAAGSSENVAAAEPKPVFRAGAFAMDITPPRFPISVNGGMRDILATNANDPLHARCLVLDDGKTRLALVVCDSCLIPRDLLDAAKERASEKTGIPTRHMLISATHTHSAPTVTGAFQSDPDAEYQQFLVGRIAEGIERAAARLQPAQIGWGSAEEPNQVFNRRWHVKQGTVLTDPFGGKTDTVQMNPGNGNPHKDRPSGPIDPEVCVLAVRSLDGRPIALLANYSLHYVGGVPAETVSADYYGEFARQIVQRLGAASGDPPCVGILSNGTSGNINNVNYAADSLPRREPFEQIRLVASSVADAAFKAWQQIEWQDWIPLAAREEEIELGVRLPSAEDVEQAKRLLAQAEDPPYRSLAEIYARETILLAKYPRTVKLKLQALRVGKLGIAAIPCETFVETGLALKKESPLKTFTISLANGYDGYLPTPQHHEWGGYETWRARSSFLEREAEPKIRETVLRLLTEVAEAKETN